MVKMGLDSFSVELEPSPEDLLTVWGVEISEKNLDLYFPNRASLYLAAETAWRGF